MQLWMRRHRLGAWHEEIASELPAVESPGGGRVRDKRAPAPADVVTVTGVGGKRVPLHRLAAAAWQALVTAARTAGIKHPLLLPTSGYRNPDRQRRLFALAVKRYGSAEEARKWVAPPGGSAHQSGRAIDFYLGGKNSSGNVARLRTLPAYRWLLANARHFGFYPYEREPWHWEYNPPATGTQELAEELGVVQELEALEREDELMNERGRWRSAGRPVRRRRPQRRPYRRQQPIWYRPAVGRVWSAPDDTSLDGYPPEPSLDGAPPEPGAGGPAGEPAADSADEEFPGWTGLQQVGGAIGGAIASAPPPVRRTTLQRLRALLPSLERHRRDIRSSSCWAGSPSNRPAASTDLRPSWTSAACSSSTRRNRSGSGWITSD